jgi:predicted acyltransferase
MSLVEVTAIKAVFGWPLYATWNALAFARGQPDRQAKTVALLSFLPVLLFTGTLWSAFWAVAIWLVTMSVSLLAF